MLIIINGKESAFFLQCLYMYIKPFVYVYAINVIILPIHILRHNFKTQTKRSRASTVATRHARL